jgi:hypothetical protein
MQHQKTKGISSVNAFFGGMQGKADTTVKVQHEQSCCHVDGENHLAGQQKMKSFLVVYRSEGVQPGEMICRNLRGQRPTRMLSKAILRSLTGISGRHCPHLTEPGELCLTVYPSDV